MKKYLFIALILISIFAAPGHPRAQSNIDPGLYQVEVPPEALIILDMSGSMNFPPEGGPYYVSPPGRRIDIAKKVLFDLLDDDKNGIIDENDEKSLKIRLGYMKFRDTLSQDDGNPMTGRIRVEAEIGSHYSDIWNKISTEPDPVGGTPLAEALSEAKDYYAYNLSDALTKCRAKFIILISDGEDTYACYGNGTENQWDMFRRRWSTVLNAKALYDYKDPADVFPGIQVFAVGFGQNMPDRLKRTLNWVAYYGGTDNSSEANSGDPGAYNINLFYSNPCVISDSTADPANYPLSGYAFLASNATELATALKTVFNYIQSKTYAFTAPVLPAVRTIDSEVAYLSSFVPNKTPFWQGHLKAYQLNSDGTLPVDASKNPVNPIWDAGAILNTISPANRKIYTVTDGVMKEFKITNVGDLKDPLELSLLEAIQLIAHIRGTDAYDLDNDNHFLEERDWKLGDLFNSQPVLVGTPSAFFEDIGFSGPGGFYADKKVNRTKVIVVGANDGMLHAFDTDGKERWGFIPNGVLTNLKNMTKGFTFYVDSTPKVADVWFDTNGDNIKTKDEWKTVLICGLRKGGNSYFALDITDTLSPKYLWDFPKPSDPVTLGKVGQSWSEPAIGRVKIEQGGVLREKWVAFIGGGYRPAQGQGIPGQGSTPNDGGNSFFVIDIKTGNILWEFSYGTQGENAYMKYSLVASPLAVDTNADGYIDRVYIGDLGGQMWVFDLPFGNVNNWSGQRLFAAPTGVNRQYLHPIFFQASVAYDKKGIPWVFFGTGDREDLQRDSSFERFYAVQDNRAQNYPYTEVKLEDVTFNNTFYPFPNINGWFIRLDKGEKVLAKPSVFNQLIYFTTQTPTQTGSATCEAVGYSKLYAVYYLSGGGALNVADEADLSGNPSFSRSKLIGFGMPSSPVITVNLKGKASILVGTTSYQVHSQSIFSPTSLRNIIYWREVAPGD